MNNRSKFIIFFLLFLLFALPVTLYLTRKGQDIRPRALQGNANLLLSTGNTNPDAGEYFDVVATIQMNDSSAKLSGADVTILYDKAKLMATNVVPAVQTVNPSYAFTEAPVVMKEGSFDNTYNFVRVALVVKGATNTLPVGSMMLAKITFKAKQSGQAVIKYPDDNRYLQIVGYGVGAQ
ncbi:hypothetical protein HYW55_00305 [Candidatus Gottesmanbacteria bacterium]|nr:hypothetical protein [Candidatus Gottesmanbacteria bacterium]